MSETDPANLCPIPSSSSSCSSSSSAAKPAKIRTGYAPLHPGVESGGSKSDMTPTKPVDVQGKRG